MTTYVSSARRCLHLSRLWLLTTALLCAVGVRAAEPADVLKAAVEKLARGSNYTWTTTFSFPNSPLHPGPINGRIDAAGYTLLDQKIGRNDFEAVIKDGLGIIKLPVGWLSAAEIAAGNPPGAINPAVLVSSVLFNIRKPDVEAADLVRMGAVFTVDDKGAFTMYLKEDAALTLLRYGITGRPNPVTPPFKEAKGTIKFWIDNGALNKYEIKLQAKLPPSAHNNTVDFNPTTTVVITNIGVTKVVVPADALQKFADLKAPPAPAK